MIGDLTYSELYAHAESLTQKLADMTADRDSWEAQADERAKDCLMFIEQMGALMKQIAEKDDLLGKANEIIKRYRRETPIGNQPYMICSKADSVIKAISESWKNASP